MEETEIDQTQSLHISKMSNCAHYATALRKFPTETANLSNHVCTVSTEQ